MIARVDVSEEFLHHFRCPCGCWWSISDFPQQRVTWPAPYIHCPRCGRALALPGIAERKPTFVAGLAPKSQPIDWSAA